ncbi:MAG: hypothetical protein ACW967_10220, partial [Candidatus Hodarchaeales archaeon]
TQILEAIEEVYFKLKNKIIDKEFIGGFEEWYWERNEKAKSEGAEKQLAFMNRLRRYLRIAIQVETEPEKIFKDFVELKKTFTELLRIFTPEKKSSNINLWERIRILENILFPKIGRMPRKGPDDALIHLHDFVDIASCLRLILTPAIPPVIPQKVEQKLFGISEKITNIFSGITLNFVTDAKYFTITTSENKKWKIPGISYKKVMEPFLSDFGVTEKKFFEALCGHIGLKIADSKQQTERYFILDPSFVDVFTKIGYLEKREQTDGSTIIFPRISEDTLFLQYLALSSTNRQAMQPDFAFWVSLVISYYLYQLVTNENMDNNNSFMGFIKDDLVRVSVIPHTVRSVIPHTVRSVALQLGGVDWYKRMPVDVETRKDVLSGLLRLSRCDFVRLQAHFEAQIVEEEYDEEVNDSQYMNDPRIWNNRKEN